MARLTTNGVFFATGDELNSKRDIFALSAAWCFFQSAAPTGWTKVTTHNDKALRVVSGTGGGSAGTNAFTTTMSSFNIGGPLISTTGLTGYALTIPEIASHTHASGGSIGMAENAATYNPDGTFTGWAGGDVGRGSGWTRVAYFHGDVISPTGTIGNAHGHGFSGTGTVPNQPLSIAVQYIDTIVCTFNG